MFATFVVARGHRDGPCAVQFGPLRRDAPLLRGAFLTEPRLSPHPHTVRTIPNIHCGSFHLVDPFLNILAGEILNVHHQCYIDKRLRRAKTITACGTITKQPLICPEYTPPGVQMLPIKTPTSSLSGTGSIFYGRMLCSLIIGLFHSHRVARDANLVPNQILG